MKASLLISVLSIVILAVAFSTNTACDLQGTPAPTVQSLTGIWVSQPIAASTLRNQYNTGWLNPPSGPTPAPLSPQPYTNLGPINGVVPTPANIQIVLNIDDNSAITITQVPQGAIGASNALYPSDPHNPQASPDPSALYPRIFPYYCFQGTIVHNSNYGAGGIITNYYRDHGDGTGEWKDYTSVGAATYGLSFVYGGAVSGSLAIQLSLYINTDFNPSSPGLYPFYEIDFSGNVANGDYTTLNFNRQ
jgi:hypothetical protein